MHILGNPQVPVHVSHNPRVPLQATNKHHGLTQVPSLSDPQSTVLVLDNLCVREHSQVLGNPGMLAQVLNSPRWMSQVLGNLRVQV